jgi:hypothetical protein
MSSSDNGVRYSVRGSRSDGIEIIAGAAVVLALLLVWAGASVAFDSPSLAIVAAGMLFLMGVALRGAIVGGRR